MFHKPHFTSVAVVLFGTLFLSPLQADDAASDRAVFDGLNEKRIAILTELETYKAETRRMVKTGKVRVTDPDILNHVQSLREQVDSIEDKMLIISLRRGWEIPKVDVKALKKTKAQKLKINPHVRRGHDELSAEFRAEARALAASLDLPPVPAPGL